MALITHKSLNYRIKKNPRIHQPVKRTDFFVFNRKKREILQLDTFGTLQRSENKPSQIIQFELGVLTKIIEIYKKRKEKAQIKKAEASEDNTYLDTVIVPVAISYKEILKNKEYRCPINKKIKEGIRFIAFYKDKEIVGYGKIEGNPIPSDDGKDNIYKFKQTNLLQIPHQRKGVFVRNKMYCNLDKLKKASNTDEIRPKD